jgi:hypothetical protein
MLAVEMSLSSSYARRCLGSFAPSERRHTEGRAIYSACGVGHSSHLLKAIVKAAYSAPGTSFWYPYSKEFTARRRLLETAPAT